LLKVGAIMMKSTTLFALMVTGGLALAALAQPAAEQDKTSALIAELKRQNEQMTAQQAVMDEKIDTVAELVRQARIFAARSGGRGGAR